MPETFTREEDVLIYTIGTMEELIAQGFVSGGVAKLSEAGRHRFNKLAVSGWRPTDDELRNALLFLQSDDATEVMDEGETHA